MACADINIRADFAHIQRYLPGSVSAIGLGVCELVDRSGQLASANCIDWLNLPVREQLSSLTKRLHRFIAYQSSRRSQLHNPPPTSHSPLATRH